MDEAKRRRLEAAGFRVGSAAEFLGLSDAENALVELRFALSTSLKQYRTGQHLSQTALARRLKSSQSRVAKMEAGDPSVSIDLLFRALFILGATPQSVAEMLRSVPSVGLKQHQTASRDEEEILTG
jgi:plasmid maintenance system antidote protein VapI